MGAVQPAGHKLAIVELRIKFPHVMLESYDKESADFLFNESSSCIDNVVKSFLRHLQATPQNACHCDDAEAYFVAWVDELPS